MDEDEELSYDSGDENDNWYVDFEEDDSLESDTNCAFDLNDDKGDGADGADGFAVEFGEEDSVLFQSTNEAEENVSHSSEDKNVPESCSSSLYKRILSFTGHTSGKCNVCGCTQFRPVKSGSKMCECGHDDYHHEWKD